MMKGYDIGIQEKKAKLFNEWETFTSNDEESIESYYHRFLKLMNDLNRNKYFPEKIASNLKFLNNFSQNGNVENLNGYNAVQNVKDQVAQNAIQNLRVQNVRNQNGLIGVPRNANQNRNATTDLDEIEEVNANYILMANLQQASNSGTQTDKALVYDLDGSAEVHNCENYYDDEIFNIFTQEEQYTKLLEPIPEPHHVPQNDNNVISEDSSVEQSGRTQEQHPANVKETRALCWE
uniref:Gag-Pol polyprotein n=1 Tax=Tanacetum cinerariifolium TaxID=118510 RepID=A0A699LB86_TANCI|nr:hypothetical protein [Tanacetum cinerariifolium]